MGVVDTILISVNDAASRVTAAVSQLDIGEKVQVWVVSPVIAGAGNVPALASGAAAAAGQGAAMAGDLLAVYVISPAAKGGGYVLELVQTIAPMEIVGGVTAQLLAALAALQKAIEPSLESVLAIYLNLKSKTMLTGFDFLVQGPQTRLAAQVLPSRTPTLRSLILLRQPISQCNA